MTQLRLSIRCAEMLEPTLTPATRKQYERVLSLARAYVYGKKKPSRELLRKAADSGSSSEPVATACARNACGGAATLERGKPDLVHSSTQSAFTKTVKWLAQNRGGLKAGAPETVRELLMWMDAQIVAGECEDAMSERAGKPVSVERVVWRGADATGKKAINFLAVLQGGDWGLVVKLGSRWAFIRGEREHVLASVPAQDFEEAVRRAASFTQK
jgi:hypothetical protein